MAEQQAKRSLRSEIKLEFNDFITLADSLAASLEAMETAAEELHDELNRKALFHDIQKAAKAIKSGIVDMGGIDFAMFKDRLETQVSQALMSSKLTLTGLDQSLDIAFNKSAMNAGLEEVFAKISIELDKQLRIILSHIQNIVTAPQSIGFDGPVIRRGRNVMPAVVRRAPQSKADDSPAARGAAMERDLAELLQRFMLNSESHLSVGYKDNPAAVQQDMGKKLDAAVQQGKGVSPTLLADTLTDIAGSILGIPLDALGPAFEAYQDYESSMVKAKMNFESKDPTYTQVAGRRVENLYARGEISADDYKNNYALLVESQRNALKKDANGGIRDDLNKLAYLNGVGTVDAATAFQLASRAYEDPREALEITRQVLKAKSIEDLDVQPASEGLAAVASQWGLQTQELEKAMNMAIQTARISQVSLQDLLEMQSKSGAVFRSVTPNLSAKDKEAAMASSLGLSSYMMESTAQSNKQGGTFFESFLDNLYAPKSVDLLDELQQNASLNGLKLSPYEDDGKGGKKARDIADVFGSIVDANDIMEKENRSSVIKPLIRQLFDGQENAFDGFLGDLKEQVAKDVAAREVLKKNGAAGADESPVAKPTGPNGTISTADVIKSRSRDIQAIDTDKILTLQAAQMDTYKYKGQQIATLFESATGKVFEDLKDEFSTLATYLNGFLRVVSNNAGLVSVALKGLLLAKGAVAVRNVFNRGKEAASGLVSRGRASTIDALRRDFNTMAGHINARRSSLEGMLDMARRTGGVTGYANMERALRPAIAKTAADGHVLNQRMQLLDSEVSRLGINESHLTVKTQPVQTEFKNATVSARMFEDELSKIAAQAGVTDQSLARLHRRINQLQAIKNRPGSRMTDETYNRRMNKYTQELESLTTAHSAGIRPVTAGRNDMSTIAELSRAGGGEETRARASKAAARGPKFEKLTTGLAAGAGALASGFVGLGAGALGALSLSAIFERAGRAVSDKIELRGSDIQRAKVFNDTLRAASDTSSSWWDRFLATEKGGFGIMWSKLTGRKDTDIYLEAKEEAMKSEGRTDHDAIQRALNVLANKNNAELLKREFELDPTKPWMEDVKGNIVDNTIRYQNISTSAEAQQIVQKQDEKMQKSLSNAQGKYEVNRAKQLQMGFKEDSTVITEMTSDFLHEQISIIDIAIEDIKKRIKDYEAQDGDLTAESYQFLKSRLNEYDSQHAQLELQDYQLKEREKASRLNDLGSLFDFKREKTDIAYRSKLADALLGGAPEDGTVAEEINKQALLAQNAVIADMIPQLQAKLKTDYDPNKEDEVEQYRNTWLQIAQLELEQKENLVKIKEAVTNKMSTFNLPSGISPMTYYESVTEQGTHKNMSLIKGDTVINLTVNGDVGSEDTLRRISEAVEAAANNPYEQAARGMADGVKRISAAPFSPIGGGTM